MSKEEKDMTDNTKCGQIWSRGSVLVIVFFLIFSIVSIGNTPLERTGYGDQESVKDIDKSSPAPKGRNLSIDITTSQEKPVLVSSNPVILLVDDDIGMSNEQDWMNNLDLYGWSYDHWDISLSGIPSLAEMQAHDAVAWTSPMGYPCIGVNKRNVIGQYLDASGRLFISGKDIGWDMSITGTDPNPVWYQSYLKATYLSDDASIDGANAINGMIGDPISDGAGPIPLNAFMCDEIGPNGGAICWEYNTIPRSGAAIRYDETMGTDTYRLVYEAFDHESIGTWNPPNVDPDRAEILDKSLKYLLGIDTYIIPLSEGWNLISLPLIQENESLDNVLENITGKWDYIQVYNSTDPNHWKTNATFKPDQLNDLKSLNHKMGFWILCTEPNVNFVVEGSEPTSTTIPLYAGWNLVGYPTVNNTITIAEALAGTNYDSVEGFNASAPYHISQLPDSYIMKPGEGYWVKVPNNTLWVVDW